MKTKIVYVLVSSKTDIYLEQAWLSIFSLKQHNSNVFVTLVIDNVTENSLDDSRKKILCYVDELIVEQRPVGFCAKESASYMKTKLREIIQGDFLFIDTDTIIMGDLSTIDNMACDIGAVPDSHVPYGVHYNLKSYIKLFKKMGFKYQNEFYYNSGVIYVKDSPIAHDFYQKWNESYRLGHDDCPYDQPHFAKVDNTLNVINELTGDWNCQIQYGVRYFANAKIIHYFASNILLSQKEYPFYFMNKSVFEQIKHEGCISDEIKNRINDIHNQWLVKTEILGGKTVDLMHSDIIKVIQKLYFRVPSVFNYINGMIGLIGRLKR